MVRIAMVTTFFPPYNFGGDGIGVERLSAALARRGFDVTVIHDADAYLHLAKAAPQPVPPPPGVKVIALKSPLGVAASFATHQLGRPVAHHARLKTLLSRRNADVTWIHNASLVGGPGLFAMGEGVRLYEAHEHWLVCPTHVLWRYNRETCDARDCLRCTLSYNRPPQLWRATGMLEREAAHIDAFIAKSAFSRDAHRRFGFPYDMNVVPYFLPDENDPLQAAAAPAHDKPFFLFVGRLEKIKGVQDILPAFAGPDGPDLVVIGDGEYAGTLRAQARDLQRVRFLGRKPPEALSPYYRDALALITPSLCFETFGIVLIEAFRRGLPVIARKLGPFPDIVRDSGAGFLFETPGDLAAAITQLAQDGALRARLGEAARTSFRAKWSEAAVMRQYLDVLAQAADKRGDRRLVDSVKERAAA